MDQDAHAEMHGGENRVPQTQREHGEGERRGYGSVRREQIQIARANVPFPHALC